MLTETEALELIRKALAIHDAERPVPSHVSVADAAEMLGVSTRTVVRMRPPRKVKSLQSPMGRPPSSMSGILRASP